MDEYIESGNIPETEEPKPYPYDAVIVLGGGLVKVGDRFYPTDYRHGDQFGILGAGLRIVAAVELYLGGKAIIFIFTTGVTEKDKEQFGENIPTEASVFRDKFLRVLAGLRKQSDHVKKFQGLEDPETVLEDRSVSTRSNIEELLKLAVGNKWKKIGLVTNNYHIPRVKALYEQELRQYQKLGIMEPDIDFLSAEDIAKATEPGKYDTVIKRFSRTAEAKRRIASDRQGLEDLRAGRYAVEEFQLKGKKP